MQQTIQGLLEGAIETHVHGSPDIIPRKMKDSELVQEALEAKMEAIVLRLLRHPFQKIGNKK